MKVYLVYYDDVYSDDMELTKIFSTEDKARAWVDEQVADREAAGLRYNCFVINEEEVEE